MAGLWNPNAPLALGLEWMPVYRALSGTFVGPYRTQVLRSTAAQAVTALRFGIGPTINQANPLWLVAELYDLANLVVPPAATVQDYAPNADGAIGAWTTGAGGVVNLFSQIDDPVVFPPVGTDRIRTFSTSPTAYHCYVATAAFPLTARVQRLTIAAVIGREVVTGSAAREFAFKLHHVPTGANFTPNANQFAPHFGMLIGAGGNGSDCGEINPITGLPWSPADVREFDGGDWQLRVESIASAGCGSQVPTMALRVHYTDPDPRAAVGVYERPTGAPGPIISTTALAELAAGAWVANWSKANAVDYAFLLRRANARAVTAGATLAQDINWSAAGAEVGPAASQPSPVPGMHSRMVAVDTLGRITSVGAPSNLNARLDLIVAGVVADDSQPYRVEPSEAVPANSSVRRVTPNGTYIAQRVTPAANQTYLGVQFVLAPPVDDTAVMTVNVRRVSDNLQMGGSLVLTAAEVRAGQSMPNAPSYFYAEGFLSAGAVLVSGTQYEIRFEPSGGSPTASWAFIAGRQDGSPAANPAGFQGAGNGIIDDGVADALFDIGAVLQAQPAAPTDPAATVIPVEQSGDSCFCSVKYVDEVLVEWTATSLGVAFARYEIERLEEDGTWVQVAVSLSEDVNVFLGTSLNRWTDRQVARNRFAKYRIRVISTAGAFSEWVETDFVSPRSYGCEVIVTSNVDPSIQLVYDREPFMRNVDLNNQSDELARIYGAYGHVSFSEPEDRGVSAAMTLIANFGRQPVDDMGREIGGPAVFEPLRRSVRAMGRPEGPIPYVCVLDYEGNRWFARVQLGDMPYDNPGWRYKADILITPLTLDNGTVEIS